MQNDCEKKNIDPIQMKNYFFLTILCSSARNEISIENSKKVGEEEKRKMRTFQKFNLNCIKYQQ
jgi:hypothetical protein